jgi:glycosyltransferase involved in cell wall biosynthesis
MPAVSVIMPAYNVADYLRDAAASVLAQTWTDLELLIVDDGSTDATPALAEAIRRDDPARVRVIAQANGGLAAARNTAMRAAAGSFFALLDSDDAWEPDFLASQMQLFAARPDLDIVTGNAVFLGSRKDGQLARPCPDTRPAIGLESIISDEEAVFIMSVYRRTVFETIGGFDETMRTNEDYDYWLRAAAAGFRFARNPQPLARYRRRDDSLSASEPRMVAGILRVYDKARTYCAAGTPARDLLEAQIARFQEHLELAHARVALAHRDYPSAARALTALKVMRPSLRNRAAAFLARYAGPALATAYQLKLRSQQ